MQKYFTSCCGKEVDNISLYQVRKNKNESIIYCDKCYKNMRKCDDRLATAYVLSILGLCLGMVYLKIK